MDNNSGAQPHGLPCPRRMFVSDAHNVAPSSFVRIMGSVVEVLEPESETPWLVLDDGTGSMLRTTCRLDMVKQLVPNPQLLLGITLDFVGTIEEQGEERILVSQTVALVSDVHAPTLRSLQICLQSQNDKTHRSRNDDRCCFMAGGYEPPTLTTVDVARYIRVGASDGGVTLEDLALVCDVETDTMRAMIQEMQINGEIYQGRGGTYMPL